MPAVSVLVAFVHTPASVALEDIVAFTLSTRSFPILPTVVRDDVASSQIF